MLARLKAIFLSAWPALVCLVLVGPWLIPALAHFSGNGHRWVDILAQFTAPALIGALVATVLVAFLKRPPLMLVALAGLAICVLAVLPQAEPARGSPDRSAPVLTVYSANLHADNADVEAIAASIRDADPDIILLIELGADAFAARDRFLEGYPYRQSSRAVVPPGSRGSVLIASRYPLSRRSTEGNERQMISAVADTPLGPVRVVGVHLTRPWPFQYQWGQIIQTQNLLTHIDAAPEPVVLAGDFNSVATGRIGRMLRSEGGLIHAPGWPGTWPGPRPGPLRMTIDQVYHSPDIAVAKRSLGGPTGSDHRPVIVDLARPAD